MICHYCPRAAVAWCDFIRTPGSANPSCDLPICNVHRRKVGHVCNRRRPSLADTIDYCTVHELGDLIDDGLDLTSSDKSPSEELEEFKAALEDQRDE